MEIGKRSAEYDAALADFNKNLTQGGNASVEKTGEELFATCGVCHALDHKLVGPPLTEIARIYGGNPGGIVTWARAPGKKRLDFLQMPSFAQLGDENLHKIAEYMLEKGGNDAGK